MNRVILQLFIIAALVCGVSACANKGRLKSPSQIAVEQAKKDKKAQEESDRAAENKDADSAPAESPAALPEPK